MRDALHPGVHARGVLRHEEGMVERDAAGSPRPRPRWLSELEPTAHLLAHPPHSPFDGDGLPFVQGGRREQRRHGERLARRDRLAERESLGRGGRGGSGRNERRPRGRRSRRRGLGPLFAARRGERYGGEQRKNDDGPVHAPNIARRRIPRDGRSGAAPSPARRVAVESRPWPLRAPCTNRASGDCWRPWAAGSAWGQLAGSW